MSSSAADLKMSTSAIKRQQQLKRENDAVASAVRKFHERLGAPPENLHTGKAKPEYSETGWTMLQKHWSDLADAIREQQNILKQPGSRMDFDGHLMLFLNADSLAVITLQCVIAAFAKHFANGDEMAEEMTNQIAGIVDIDEAEKKKNGTGGATEGDDAIEPALETRTQWKRRTALGREIAERCQEECNVMSDTSFESGRVRCLEKYPAHRKTAVWKDIREVLFRDWGDKERDLRVGCRLLAIAAESDIVSIDFISAPGENFAWRVALSESFEKAFAECRDAHQQLLTPKYRPMVVPPLRWGVRLNDGGYLYNKDGKVREKTHLIIHRTDPQIKAELKKADFTKVLAAVNAIQETKWRINRKIHEVMLPVREMRQNQQLADLTLKQRERLSPLRRQGRFWVSVLQEKWGISADIEDEPAIYFPHRLDYRGRAYPLPHAVHPQADDAGRSLLEFGDGKPFGTSGERWMAIHLANAWAKDDSQGGVTRRLDKASFGDRVRWTSENSEKIVSCALDPLNDHWWMKADKPWRFLAACFEWQAYHADKAGFLSHLPVTIDGTCNGLQHLSALRLDEDGARQTNLMPGDQPADIYETVASEVVSELADIAEDEGHEEKEEASMWHWSNLKLPPVKNDPNAQERYLMIDRDACKTAVMTTPYGVTEKGIQRQLFGKELSKPMRKRAMYALSAPEIRQPRAFVNKLRDPENPLSQFIWGNFTQEEQEELSVPGEVPQALRRLLVQGLSRIINGPLIYDTQRFAGIELSEEAKRLVAAPEQLVEAVQPLTGSALLDVDADERLETMQMRTVRRVNRLLLEDAYPDEIKQTQTDRWRHCGYLAKKLSKCIDRLVDPGNTVATWFKTIARVVTKAKRGIRWTAPSGFPVIQESWEQKDKKISVGESEVVVWEPTQLPDVKAQERKIVANFIHSLDAAHLVLTIGRLHSEGLRHFGVIHDCFAVHACDVDQLSTALREEFVGMYRIPEGGVSLLEKFRVDQESISGVALDPPPPPGRFRIEEVLKSEYFFC